MQGRKSPLWKIKLSDFPDSEIMVHAGINLITIEQDPDMIVVPVEEAKELVNVLKSAIDHTEEN